MTSTGLSDRPSFARTLSVRITLVALAAIVLQLLVVVVINDFDYETLYLDHINYEAAALLKGVSIGPDGPAFVLPSKLTQFRDDAKAAYAFRVLDMDGRVIAAHNGELLEAVSPWIPNSPKTTDYWFKQLNARTLHIAGGRKYRVGDAHVLVETATLGDPARVHRWVVAYETLEDVWLPVMPFALSALLVTLFSVRRALNPLESTAQQVEAIVPGNSALQLDLAGLPREAAVFASAINGLMQRMAAAAHSQKVFIASAAHELRTPLAVMLLELEKIDHPRARRLEADVAGMAESVARLLVLARMDMMQPPELADLDITAVAGETVDRLRAWAAAQQHEIELHLGPPQILRGDPAAIREALRNLVENAVKHTPAGTRIRVEVRPDGAVVVEDSGPGIPSELAAQLFEPFRKGDPSTEGAGLGLTIVRRAVELHHGAVEVGRSSLGGAAFTLRFDASRGSDASTSAT